MTMWLPVECDECGATIPASIKREVDGKQVCQECFEQIAEERDT